MINLQLVPQCGNELHSHIEQKAFYGCEGHIYLSPLSLSLS